MKTAEILLHIRLPHQCVQLLWFTLFNKISNPVISQEAAAEAWRRYKLRNDSFVVDNFQGQYRSELLCPKCEKVSVTFDPYMYVSVPIPKETVEISVIVFREFRESRETAPLKVQQRLSAKNLAHTSNPVI